MFPELTRDEVFMIATRRLWLRWPQLADAVELAALSGHPDVAATTASWPVGADAEFARGRIAKGRARNAAGLGLVTVIALKSQWARPIGVVGIDTDADEAGPFGWLGYHLAPAMWGRGYASEALAALVDMTRLLSRVPRLKAGVMPHNEASKRVLDKNGFVFTGIGTHVGVRGPFAIDVFERDLRRIGASPPPVAAHAPARRGVEAVVPRARPTRELRVT